MKLNLGSGPVRNCPEGFDKGWVNVDFRGGDKEDIWKDAEYLTFDMTITNWPIEGNTVDCIFASHIIEHITYPNLLPVIKECYRILKPGQPIRILCPDPRIFIANWQAKNKQFLIDSYGQDNYDRWDYEHNPHIGSSDMFFHEHYDHYVCPSIDLIMIMMIKAGFSEVYELNYGNTKFPQYYGTMQFDSHTNSIDNRPSMSYYLEGVK